LRYSHTPPAELNAAMICYSSSKPRLSSSYWEENNRHWWHRKTNHPCEHQKSNTKKRRSSQKNAVFIQNLGKHTKTRQIGGNGQAGKERAFLFANKKQKLC
jgi:hypothetical protein